MFCFALKGKKGKIRRLIIVISCYALSEPFLGQNETSKGINKLGTLSSFLKIQRPCAVKASHNFVLKTLIKFWRRLHISVLQRNQSLYSIDAECMEPSVRLSNSVNHAFLLLCRGIDSSVSHNRCQPSFRSQNV